MRGHSQATAGPVFDSGRTLRRLTQHSWLTAFQPPKAPPHTSLCVSATPQAASRAGRNTEQPEATPIPPHRGRSVEGPRHFLAGPPGCLPPRGRSSSREQSHCPPGLRQTQLRAGAPTRGDVRQALLVLQHLPRGTGRAESDPEVGLRPGGTQDPLDTLSHGPQGRLQGIQCYIVFCHVYEFNYLQTEHLTPLASARASRALRRPGQMAPRQSPRGGGDPGSGGPDGWRRLVEGSGQAGYGSPSSGAPVFGCLAQLSPPSRCSFCPKLQLIKISGRRVYLEPPLPFLICLPLIRPA